MKSKFIFGLAIMIFVPLAGNKLTIALAQEIQVFEDAGVKFGGCYMVVHPYGGSGRRRQ